MCPHCAAEADPDIPDGYCTWLHWWINMGMPAQELVDA